ncbi:hypothetical protein TNCV_103541 [Trichonephila clavipes]|nr:hypothetical protein TNCV_103541 [Trichonephila clavipes]
MTDFLPTCAPEVEERVDLSEPMKSDTEAEMGHETLIKTVTLLYIVWDPGKHTSCNRMTPTAVSDVVQSGRPIFDDFFQHLWPYIGNNTANVVFQMVKRLWLIRIDQLLYIAPQKIV